MNRTRSARSLMMLALVPLALLAACVLSPGKFTSTLDIRADRSFTFTYQGELIAAKSGGGLGDAMAGDSGSADKAAAGAKGAGAKAAPAAATDKDEDARLTAIATALAKERGFRSARYVGNRKFVVDYAISSRLDHSFVFPFNIDAQAVFPFLAVEVRADGKVRMQAPGFANDADKGGGLGNMPGSPLGDSAKALDGTFTLTTDAEIVSHNQEDGASPSPRGKQIVWKVSPLTRTAPMATLRFADGT